MSASSSSNQSHKKRYKKKKPSSSSSSSSSSQPKDEFEFTVNIDKNRFLDDHHSPPSLQKPSQKYISSESESEDDITLEPLTSFKLPDTYHLKGASTGAPPSSKPKSKTDEKITIETKQRMIKPSIHKQKQSGALYSKMDSGPYDLGPQQQHPSSTGTSNYLDAARDYLEGKRELQRTTIDLNENETYEIIKNILSISSALSTSIKANPYYRFASEVGTKIKEKADYYIESSTMEILKLLKLDDLRKQKNAEYSLRNLSLSLHQISESIKSTIPGLQSQDVSDVSSAIKESQNMILQYHRSIQNNISFLQNIARQGSILATRKFFLKMEFIAMVELTFNRFKNWVENTRDPMTTDDQNIIDIDINTIITDYPNSRQALVYLIFHENVDDSGIKGYKPTTNRSTDVITAKIDDDKMNLLNTLRRDLAGSSFTPILLTPQTPFASPYYGSSSPMAFASSPFGFTQSSMVNEIVNYNSQQQPQLNPPTPINSQSQSSQQTFYPTTPLFFNGNS